MRLVTTVRRGAGLEAGERRQRGPRADHGLLHAGHLSLVEAARRENDRVAASLFVNPTQFGPHEDLARYPRDLARDRALLERAGVRPPLRPRPPRCTRRASRLGRRRLRGRPLEGERRPGHFRGVATVVLKLLPHRDAGPRLLRREGRPAAGGRPTHGGRPGPARRGRACPMVREADGLAMSSRNSYWARKSGGPAASLSRGARRGRGALAAGERSGESSGQAMRGDRGGAARPARLRERRRSPHLREVSGARGSGPAAPRRLRRADAAHRQPPPGLAS